MTKSNDLDPWLNPEASETEGTASQEEPKPKARQKGSKVEKEAAAASVESTEDSPNNPTVDDAPDVPADNTEPESSPESKEDSTTEFVPTVVPERTGDRTPRFEPYTAHKGASDETFTRRSEATYLPSKPKLYVVPKSDDEEEDGFGFPAVPADTQRLFIAIEIPRKLKREFGELARSFRPREYDRVRWIEEEAMHLTLKFLGDTPIDQIADIKNALHRTADSTGKFSIKIGRTGCFPSFVDPRICWVGFTGELRRLEQLQGRVEGGMVALGLDADDRKFRAHITVGRTRPGIRGRFAEDVGLSWQHAPLRSTGTIIPVTAIALYRSYIDDNDDTQYQQLGNYELG